MTRVDMALSVWKAEVTFIHFSDIQNNYSRYPERICDIWKCILGIQNTDTLKGFPDIKNNYFGYPK